MTFNAICGNMVIPGTEYITCEVIDMKRTIGVKRGETLKEWLSACFGNTEGYYTATLWEGIPDGDDIPTVLEDLQDGFYDDDIDDTIDAAGFQLPTKNSEKTKSYTEV